MSPPTKRELLAWQRLEQHVRTGTRSAADPGLRKRFEALQRAPVRLICCTLDKGINHGNLLRVAECFRLQEVCFAPVANRKEIDMSGCMAAKPWQPYRWQNPMPAIEQAKADGFAVFGLTLTETATPLRRVEWRHPAAIVVGREREGLDADVQEECDELVAIPLYGFVPSLNVAVTAGIAVESCVSAYALAHPEFRPARAVSQHLLKTSGALESRAP